MAGRFSIEAVFKAVDRVTAPVSRMQNRVGKFTRKMERGLRNVNRRLDKMVGGLKRGAAVALKFGGAAIAAGVTATALAINKVADAADALAKRTRRIKFPIEAFQEWQFVAEQSGISSEMFDKSLEKFVKTVGEARAGTGTLVTILKKTNKPLLRQVTNAKTAAEALDIYIDALRSTENVLDRTALATAAFGRTGAKFLNITEQSAEAISKLRFEQRENGIITAQQAKFAEDYNDAVNSLKRSLFGLLQTVIIPMLPKMTEMVTQWREWVVANKELVRSNVIDFFIKLKNSAADIGNTLVTVVKVVAVIISFNVAIKAITISVIAFNVAFTAYTALMSALPKVLALARVAMLALNIAMTANPVGLLIKGISVLIGLGAAVMVAWEPVGEFFSGLFDKVSAIASKAGDFLSFGFGDDDEEESKAAATPAPQVAGPPDRVARLMEESRTTSTAEVTIRDESGRAEVTAGTMGAGVTLQPTGAF